MYLLNGSSRNWIDIHIRLYYDLPIVCLIKDYSLKTLDNNGNNDIGLQFDRSVLKPFLNTGFSFTILQASGTIERLLAHR